MTGVLTANERGGVDAERDRIAWNLPPSPVPATPHSVVPAADIESLDPDATIQPVLDWEAFRSRYFPGRRRHDLEAITSYGAYRSSRDALERPAEETARPGEPEPVQQASAAMDSWEDEGGATR
jgi:hypothetical protein